MKTKFRHELREAHGRHKLPFVLQVRACTVRSPCSCRKLAKGILKVDPFPGFALGIFVIGDAVPFTRGWVIVSDHPLMPCPAAL